MKNKLPLYTLLYVDHISKALSWLCTQITPNINIQYASGYTGWIEKNACQSEIEVEACVYCHMANPNLIVTHFFIYFFLSNLLREIYSYLAA